MRSPEVIETLAKTYKDVVGQNDSGNTNEDALSILSLIQEPPLTTSLITKGSPDTHRTKMTKIKTQVSQLSTCITNVIKMCNDNRAADNEREERDRAEQ